MPIILPNGGINRTTKKVPLADLSGVQRSAKTGWLGCPSDGVTRKIFSAYDCQGYLTNGNFSSSTLNADGSATVSFYNQTSSKGGGECTIRLEFDELITFPGVIELHFAHYTEDGYNYVSDSRTISVTLYNGDTQVGSFSGFPSARYPGTTTVQANKLDIRFEVVLRATTTTSGSYTFSWGPGDLMINDKQIKGIELI